jgi:uncharacterized membrane protein (DUF485 family)
MKVFRLAVKLFFKELVEDGKVVAKFVSKWLFKVVVLIAFLLVFGLIALGISWLDSHIGIKMTLILLVALGVFAGVFGYVYFRFGAAMFEAKYMLLDKEGKIDAIIHDKFKVAEVGNDNKK